MNNLITIGHLTVDLSKIQAIALGDTECTIYLVGGSIGHLTADEGAMLLAAWKKLNNVN